MGAVCPGCVRGSDQEEKAYYQTTSQYPPWPQQPAPPQPRPRPPPHEQIKQQPQQPLRPQQQVLRPQYAQQPQPQPPQQRRTSTAEEEVDRARSDEARANAAIAAQKRAEAFEKSAGGRAARTAIAAAKANPLPGRNEPGLRWVVG